MILCTVNFILGNSLMQCLYVNLKVFLPFFAVEYFISATYHGLGSITFQEYFLLGKKLKQWLFLQTNRGDCLSGIVLILFSWIHEVHCAE